ncbi:hypothetical protein [Marinitenerispora sediminis]|uniref:RNA polymerase subunit sigma-70 n=1 Tax=Marinitenerispora sediminis TaxID=1931232 RepID=A0A368T864_9ACTN|nr:hypothetical protein [Marinitenerispora sediminis]RCV56536.1 hypothetical protein DEF28_03460 [Marinitenerispora sediminis]RCV60113.1 hypothetical protein DEF23_05530 [Marinitenerispora sediminis]RCV60366.1 hypothetical protein DEF24_07355 [Marinitenerispora sediminis]
MEHDRISTLTASVRDDAPLTALRAAAQLRRELEQLEAVNVRKARTQGATWAEIATVLGISKQAVHKKYGGSRRER